MDRRNFLNTMGLGGLGLLTLSSLPAFAEDFIGSALFPVPVSPSTLIGKKVVIVGGGMAGATLAKYLRLWGGEGLQVTLVEKNATYTSNIMSNTVLTGQRSLANLAYNYNTLVDHYGVKLIQQEVTSINENALTLSDGSTLSGYQRLVLAPGIEFDLMPGMTDVTEYETTIPHAWRAGPQTTLLRTQLESMTGGIGNDVIITIPKAPYRCPPGPYERTCVIADWLKTNKPGSKVIVLDANQDILVEKDNFNHAFTVTHAGVVDYRKGCSITDVQSDNKTVTYNTVNSLGEVTSTSNLVKAKVLNPIPPQRAPDLLKQAGLLDSTRFAPVNVLSYESTVKPGVHIIGDASKTTMPKAGHIGNQEAKTCADAIIRLLQNQSLDPSPVTNSACFTPITSTTATWLSAVYQYDTTSKTMKILTQHNNGQAISATSATTENYQEMLTWFDTLMSDTFS